VENNGGSELEVWDDDDWDGPRPFGDRAKFLMMVGGDVFRNGATLVFECYECSKIRTHTPREFIQVMGMVLSGGLERHERAVKAELRLLRDLESSPGVCVCKYLRKGREDTAESGGSE
jgi:hypothetical protein